MTLIRALPAEFDNFTSALLLQKDVDKAKVIDAFVTEESNHLHCSTQSAMLSNKHIPSSTSIQPSTKWCNFCDLSTHNTDVCYLLANAKKSNLERKQTAKQEKKQKQKEQKAQQADAGETPTQPPEATGSASTVASIHSHLSAHLASNASYLWCTDSGA